jgi:hypothetical protein
MKLKKYYKKESRWSPPLWGGKWQVVESGKVLYISRNKAACERYIKIHSNGKK